MGKEKINRKNGFSMDFDSNTIDHLGIRLYSQFPPVLAELVSNSYDAEANNVDIIINRSENKIIINDDGIGMSHDEINDAYLKIGRNRRVATGTGLSKNNKRMVTGKKGLGKLAIFGVAKTLTVSSVSGGYRNSFKINYDAIKDSIPPFKPEVLAEYENCSDNNGTSVIIEDISIKIGDAEQLAIGLAKRFNFFDDEFHVTITDGEDDPVLVTREKYMDTIDTQFSWSFPESFSELLKEKTSYSFLNNKGITGQIYTANTPLKQKDQGFNVYARGKLASQGIFFNDRSNDNFNQYVFGYFNIDVLDSDDQVDLIGTARQSILWDQDDNVSKIREHLDDLIKNINREWRIKRAEKKGEALSSLMPDDFYDGLSTSEINQIKKIKNSLLSNSINENQVEPIVSILRTVKDLFGFQSFQDYVESLSDSEITVENIEKISNDWERIEAKELAKVATGRIGAIDQFEKFIREDASETKAIQPFLEKFPWVLNPRITTFEREKTFKKILQENFPDKELEGRNRRLDFLCYLTNGELIIIELKRPSIKISLKEINQALEYKEFIEKNHQDAIYKGVSTYLVSDRYDFKEDAKRIYPSLEQAGTLKILSYSDLLIQARKYNEEFINVYELLEEKSKEIKQN